MPKFMKKKRDIPSGPGDFDGCIWNSTCLTSSGLCPWSKVLFISRVTKWSIKFNTSLKFVGLDNMNKSWKYWMAFFCNVVLKCAPFPPLRCDSRNVVFFYATSWFFGGRILCFYRPPVTKWILISSARKSHLGGGVHWRHDSPTFLQTSLEFFSSCKFGSAWKSLWESG